MSFSVSEMYLIPKAKTSLRVLKIQYLRDGFESPMDRGRRFESLYGLKSQFQKVKKTKTGEGNLNPFIEDSNPFERRNFRSALRERRAFLSMFQNFFGFIYF